MYRLSRCLTDHLVEQKRRNGGDYKGYDYQAEWVGQNGAIAALAARKSGEKFITMRSQKVDGVGKE